MEPKFLGDKEKARELWSLAKIQLSILINQMKFNNLKQGSRLLKLPANCWIKVSMCFGLPTIEIFVPEISKEKLPVVVTDFAKVLAGFVCVPRETIEDAVYPLIDDDKTSNIVAPLQNGWKRIGPNKSNYGNLDWKGSDKKVVSWRGPASRSFEMDSLQKYDGFTSWDYTVMGGGLEIEHYTPYLNKVYQAGKVSCEFLEGYKVLGCALLAGKLVTVVGVDYTGRTNPDGSNGYFYDEVWLNKSRIGWKRGERPDVPWFFSVSGLKAVHKDELLIISEDLKSVSFSELDAGSGTQTNKYNGTNDWGVESSGSWVVCRDFLNNEMQNIVLNSELTEDTVVDASSSETVDELTIYYSGTDEPTVTVTGPEGYAGEGAYDYSVEGNHCGIDSVDWTYPTGCGMGTVSVVVTFEGGNTASGSMQVRMPSGMWVTDGYEYGPDYSTSNSGINTVVVSGEYEYTHYKGADMNITATHFTTDFPTSSEPSCPGCRSVTDGGTDYSRGSGEDYTYGGTTRYYGSTSCCPGAQQGTDYNSYYKLYCISRRKWVCP